jgi:3-hydroxyisobutyrate dehydrogenase-like beta-hydroxyacid dehydrogenase
MEKTIGILSPGVMGHAVGRVLGEHGLHVVTCLAGRSAITRERAEKASMVGLADIDAVVAASDMILAILPPADAVPLARAVAAAMAATKFTPVYADCNAIAPATTREVARIMGDVKAPFIDAGIIGGPPEEGYAPRIYCSGPETGPLMALDGMGIAMKDAGGEIGAASGVKMCYAALTKGTMTLHTAVLIAAERLGLRDVLWRELEASQEKAAAAMTKTVPFLPADSARWVGEMEEIAKTFGEAGLPPGFHKAAADIFRVLAGSHFAGETRETMNHERTLDEAVRAYADVIAEGAKT